MKKRKLLGIGLAVVLVLPSFAQSKDPALPVGKEPSHHIRFDNGRVRVYDVQVPKGQWTEFHEHTWDNFFVFMVPTTQAFEFSDGRHGTREVKAGDVGFSSTSAGAYTHRVMAQGELPLHVVDIEILNNAVLGSGVAGPKRPESSFKIVLENPRGRAYDFVLKTRSIERGFCAAGEYRHLRGVWGSGQRGGGREGAEIVGYGAWRFSLERRFREIDD